MPRRLTRTPMFTAATVIVLLIACANIANLLLVQTEGRAQELRAQGRKTMRRTSAAQCRP